MKVKYKGFELSASREKSMGGWDTLYFYIFTPTGYCLVDSFEDSSEKVRDKIQQLKETVDDYILNPQDYED
jgi:hypothetical protein